MIVDVNPNLIHRILSQISKIPPELVKRKLEKNPINFLWLEKDKFGHFRYRDELVDAQPIGDEISIKHHVGGRFRFYAINASLTEEYYLNSMYKDVNALHIIYEKSERFSEYFEITTYQPFRVPQKVFDRFS